MNVAGKLALVAAAIVAFAGFHLLRNRWRDVEAEDGRFSVRVPGPLGRTDGRFPMSYGHDTRVTYECRRGSFTFTVGHFELPAGATKGPDEVLADVLHAAQVQLGGRFDAAGETRAIEAAPGPALEIAFDGRRDGDARRVRARAFFAAGTRRVYLLMVDAPAELIGNGHAERFFTSFRPREGA